MELLVHLLRDQADVLLKIARDAAAKVDDIEDYLLGWPLAPQARGSGQFAARAGAPAKLARTRSGRLS